MNEDMIPVFIPKEIGMRAIHAFAADNGCRLIVSNSGAIALEPYEPEQSGTVVRFISRDSTAPDFAPEIA